MALANEVVFKQSDSPITWTLQDSSGTPIPFQTNGVTKVELYLGDIVISSDTGDITYNNDLGIITINIPETANLVLYKEYNATLKVYDPVHIKGQVLINRAFENSNATVKLSNFK